MISYIMCNIMKYLSSISIFVTIKGEEYCAGKQGQIVQTSDCHPSAMHFYSFSRSAQDFVVSLKEIHVPFLTNPGSNLVKSM